MELLITVLLTSSIIAYIISRGNCIHDYEIEEIEIKKGGSAYQKSKCKKCGKIQIREWNFSTFSK